MYCPFRLPTHPISLLCAHAKHLPFNKQTKNDSCRAAQDAVRLFESPENSSSKGSGSSGGSSEGLALVLNHCNVDSRNPYLREWALLCVRHLCEGNEANQAAIAAMRPQAAVQTQGLREMGVEARLVGGDGEGEGGGGGPRVVVRKVPGAAGDGEGKDEG